MKVELNDLRLGITALEEKAAVGIMDKKNPMLWKEKKDIHNDFIHAVVTCWKNKKQMVRLGEFEYEISVKETKIKKKK